MTIAKEYSGQIFPEVWGPNQVTISDDGHVGCTSKVLVQATWPHSAAAGTELTLRNGDLTVYMHSFHGLPYGVYPRLIMCWLTQEASYRAKLYPLDEARMIPLDASLSGFLRKLGLQVTGGKKGTIALVEKQLRRMIGTTIMVTYNTNDGERKGFHHEAALLIDKANLWWDMRQPDQGTLETSEIRLSREFFEDLIKNPVPLDMAILGEVRKSPLAIDMYAWLTYRLSYLNIPTVVRWEHLKEQFGASYPDTPQGHRDFKKKAIAALKKVKEAWPTATASVVKDGILLRPGKPSVATKKKKNDQ